MKNIILENGKGLKKEFRILFTINTENDKNYAIVTDDEVYKDEYIKSFVFMYRLNKRTKKYTYTSVKNIKELDYIDKLLKSLQIESEI
jgi:uncharacterized protein YrzB (UPF0473 family)